MSTPGRKEGTATIMRKKLDKALMLKIPQDWFDALKLKSFEISLATRREVKHSDLIRNAIAKEHGLTYEDTGSQSRDGLPFKGGEGND